MYDICILTDDAHLKSSNDNGLVANVHLEDGLVAQALQDLGLRVTRRSWSDPDFDWSTCRALIVRSTWDYMDKFKAFTQWLSELPDTITLYNTKQTLLWNTDKHYLKDLERKGIPICPSVFVPSVNTQSLSDWVEQYGLDEFVLKPCVSAGGKHTYRINAETIGDYENLFLRLTADEAFMLQPFQKHILTHGEISLMYFNGDYSHAVIKKAKAGDFRVQDDFGGTVALFEPDSETITLGEKVLQACPEMPIYARVDLIWENHGGWVLSEVELVEPELWFRFKPEVTQVLAQAIYADLS